MPSAQAELFLNDRNPPPEGNSVYQKMKNDAAVAVVHERI